jgi:hypothetical protein
MPQNDALANAKNALAGANKKFPGAMAASAGVKPAGARVTPPVKVAPTEPAKATPTLGDELKAKSDNVDQYIANTPKMHQGGVVKAPATDSKVEGRNSEYRKVFVARRQSRSGGGNKPVTESPEKHDSKKAEEGIKEKKA